jgi:hypothetical protein
MTNLEKWACVGFAGGQNLGNWIYQSDVTWLQKVSMIYAVQCLQVYAAMRVTGGLDAPE